MPKPSALLDPRNPPPFPFSVYIVRECWKSDDKPYVYEARIVVRWGKGNKFNFETKDRSAFGFRSRISLYSDTHFLTPLQAAEAYYKRMCENVNEAEGKASRAHELLMSLQLSAKRKAK